MSVLMKLALPLLCALLGSCSALPPAVPVPQGSPNLVPHEPAQLQNRITGYVGGRALDDSDWEPVDRQPALGLQFARQGVDAALGWEAGAMFSSDDSSKAGTPVRGRTRELYLGVHARPEAQRVHPVVGAGVSFLRGELDSGPLDSSDTAFAGYGHIGLDIDVTSNVSFGIDYRLLLGSSMRIAGFDIDANYQQFALTFGFGF
jgi:opacity protein-like surface antigen